MVPERCPGPPLVDVTELFLGDAFIISCDSEPGATRSIKSMYLQVVLDRFQNAERW